MFGRLITGSPLCAERWIAVRVDPAWLDRVPKPKDLEASMLDEEDLAARMRLSCQILMTPELDGLTVEIPSTQR
jgi:2Fe-2S ferredoxin